MAPLFLWDNLRTRRPGVRIPHGVPKIPEIVRFRGFLFCISCYFRLPFFLTQTLTPTGADSAGEHITHGLPMAWAAFSCASVVTWAQVSSVKPAEQRPSIRMTVFESPVCGSVTIVIFPDRT